MRFGDIDFPSDGLFGSWEAQEENARQKRSFLPSERYDNTDAKFTPEEVREMRFLQYASHVFEALQLDSRQRGVTTDITTDDPAWGKETYAIRASDVYIKLEAKGRTTNRYTVTSANGEETQFVFDYIPNNLSSTPGSKILVGGSVVSKEGKDLLQLQPIVDRLNPKINGRRQQRIVHESPKY